MNTRLLDSLLSVGEGHTPLEADRVRRLWIAVLYQQIKDAAMVTSRSDQLVLRDAAHRFLTTNTPDFREVCENAGLNPNYILRACQRLLALEDPSDYIQRVTGNRHFVRHRRRNHSRLGSKFDHQKGS